MVFLKCIQWVLFCLLVTGSIAVGQDIPATSSSSSLFTGNPPICPRWAFEPWVWEDNGNTQQSTLELADGYLKRQIPVGAVIVDSPWTTSYCSFEWDTDRYPHPQQMIDTLHGQGVRVVMWTGGAMNRLSKDTPQNKAPAYDAVIEQGLVVDEGREIDWWKGTGVHIDFTNPKAREWFAGQMAKLMKMGVDGWKVDQTDQNLGDKVQTSIGVLDRADFKPYYYAALADISRQQNPESLILARPYSHQGGFAASINKCTIGWCGDFTGDWQGLRHQLHDTYKSANAGYGALAVEVGGFYKVNPDKETLIRYTQFGALMPVMINGGMNGGLTHHLPWFHDDQTVDIYRYYAVLHSELGPYLFSVSVDSHLNGGSIVKSADIDAAQHGLGEQFFVSLVTSPEGHKEITLPSTGEWIDYWDETKLYPAGSKLSMEIPLDRTGLFIRAGAIVPMNVDSDVTGHGDVSYSGKETVVIYPYGQSEYLYHRPQSTSTVYDDVKIRVDEESGILSVEGDKEIAYRFRIKSFHKPKGVKGADAWRYDPKSGFVIIDKTGASFSIDIDGLQGYLTLQNQPSQAAAQLPGSDGKLIIAVIGDSTVCEYPSNQVRRGWGQFIGEYFDDSVSIRNTAQSGRSTKTFIKERFWEKTLKLRPDYVLIQFGHNDSHPSDRPEATDATTDYQDYLRRYIDESRQVGATPVLVTPMYRRRFDEQGRIQDNLLPYANAMKKVAAEKNVPVVDLNAASEKLYLELGPAGAAELANADNDMTHFNEKGARAMARLVMEQLPNVEPPLKPYLE